MTNVRIRKIGNSLRVILPKETLEALGALRPSGRLQNEPLCLAACRFARGGSRKAD